MDVSRGTLIVPSSWREYRFWSRLCWLLALGFLPGATTLAIALQVLFKSETTAFLVFFAWIGALSIVGHRAISFHCPRCGQPYFYTISRHNTLTKKCLHCG